MFEDLKKILDEQLHLGGMEITKESRIKEDLGADSLDVLQMLMTIEEEHGIVIPDEELATFETVGDILNFLEKNQK
ncbi:MAG: acyl carrier protein [Ruminococcus sp.]|uniref:acyl carrier protein n=1 Tax=Ruminococcus sp. TaxID=41978 RepID=UPI002872D06A|nr:acyl carrier protein [Ruminococcus sp.]MBQ3285900.1 acyl carrier protein [Ruminococcus sp.]